MGSRILIVDDDAFNREAIKDALSEEGYEVFTAPHGQAALQIVEQSPPDLILLDIFMSVMDGPEFAQTYRQKPGPHAPIVVITARQQAAAQADQIGADGFLGKPFQVNDLLSEITRHLPAASDG